MRIVSFKFAISFLLLSIIAIFICGYSELVLFSNKEDKLFVVEKGESISGIAENLKTERIIGSALIFKIYAKYSSIKGRYIIAGEYLVPEGYNVLQLFSDFAKGKRFKRHITIPEGLTAKQISKLIDNSYGLKGETQILRDCDMLPGTFYYYYGDPKSDITQKLRDGFIEAIAKYLPENKSGLRDLDGIITLASIVERESALDRERDIVASVYLNRLKINMMLQADPTVEYAVSNGEGKLGRPLFRTDLGVNSPYNTYFVQGLPPTPICCPGLKSIQAVLNPAETKYLYFVADGKGAHKFASNLKDHNVNVSEYRKLQRMSGKN